MIFGDQDQNSVSSNSSPAAVTNLRGLPLQAWDNEILVCCLDPRDQKIVFTSVPFFKFKVQERNPFLECFSGTEGWLDWIQ